MLLVSHLNMESFFERELEQSGFFASKNLPPMRLSAALVKGIDEWALTKRHQLHGGDDDDEWGP